MRGIYKDTDHATIPILMLAVGRAGHNFAPGRHQFWKGDAWRINERAAPALACLLLGMGKPTDLVSEGVLGPMKPHNQQALDYRPDRPVCGDQKQPGETDFRK